MFKVFYLYECVNSVFAVDYEKLYTGTCFEESFRGNV